MKVTILLADAAQAVDGKLYVLGGGWSLTGPDPVPSALAIKIEVPWNDTNRLHHWVARLVGEDGQQVALPAPEEPAPVEVGGQFEVGRPPGIREGTPLDVVLAVNLAPLPLEPGRYEWRLYLNEETSEDWYVAFTVRPRPTGR